METTHQTPLSWIRDYPTKGAVELALQEGYTPQQIYPVLRERLEEFFLWYKSMRYLYQQRGQLDNLRWIFITTEQSKKFTEYIAMYNQLAEGARDDISILQKDGLEAWLLTQPSL